MNSKNTWVRLTAFSTESEPSSQGIKGSAGTKGVGEGVAHAVPISGAEAQVILHLLAFNLLFGVVVLESEVISGIFAFEGYFETPVKYSFMICFGSSVVLLIRPWM